MTEAFRSNIDLALKIGATLIAIFGVWKFFAEREAAEVAAAKAKSITFIERYAGPDLSAARAALFKFWIAQSQFINHLKSNKITPRAYSNFVYFRYPRYSRREELQQSLFTLANMYDQLFHCRQARICDAAILDDYFCTIAIKQRAVYGPFYSLLRESLGSTDFGKGLERYVEICDSRGRLGGD